MKKIVSVCLALLLLGMAACVKHPHGKNGGVKNRRKSAHRRAYG